MAATVIIATPKASEGFEIFMVKRTHKSGFMAGAHVFPGGVLDDEDGPNTWRAHYASAGFRDLPEDFSFRMASIREAFEESGVLLLADPDKAQSLQGDARLSWRERVHEDAAEFQRLCLELESLPDVFSLKAWAHWITPTAEPKRYDTRFYVAWVPELPDARHDEQETVASTWSSPKASVESFEQGTMFLPPPTWYILRELSAYQDWSGIKNADRLITPIQPFFGSAEGSLVLAMPGDALHGHNMGENKDCRNRIVILSNGRYAYEHNLEGGP
jgi:nucleoside diphosphate-linked moiety X motif protein 19